MGQGESGRKEGGREARGKAGGHFCAPMPQGPPHPPPRSTPSPPKVHPIPPQGPPHPPPPPPPRPLHSVPVPSWPFELWSDPFSQSFFTGHHILGLHSREDEGY